MNIKLRTFLQSFVALPLIGCAHAFVGNSPEEIKHRKGLPSTSDNTKTSAPTDFSIGDIVKWNDWAGYMGKEHLVRISLVTQVWDDDTVLLDDHRGIHIKYLTKIGHCDSITANQGAIIDKIKT